MGYGDFGIYNSGLSATPNLDNLTTEGLCLGEHYSASCVCAPARASIFTGRYPHRTGVIDTLEAAGLDRLHPNEVTLADILKAAGYVTGLIGKWHLGAIDLKYHPNKRGFDEFIGFRGGWQDYFNWSIEKNGKQITSDGRYLTDVFTNEGVSFIHRHKSDPFFLHVAYNAPHFPIQAPEDRIAPYRENGDFTEGVSTLYAMIACMDDGVGRILETVRKLGLEQNTLIMFTSDNGPDFGGSGEQSLKRFNAGLNGSKGNVFEGGIKVPAVIRWPGMVPAGRQSNAVVHFSDWFSTLASLGGASVPKDRIIDGFDISDCLFADRASAREQFFWQWTRYKPQKESNAALRIGNWKLIRPPVKETLEIPPEEWERDRMIKYHPEDFTLICKPFGSGAAEFEPHPVQLFNIKDDPGETQDVSHRQKKRCEQMQQKLNDVFEDVTRE